MTILSLRSRSTRFNFKELLLKFVWRFPSRAGRALLQALHDSRSRAAVKVLQEYGHLNAADQGLTGRRSTPRQ